MSPLRAAKLRAIPLFAELEDDVLERIAAIAVEVQVQAGQVLARPYEHGSGMFVIEEGTVAVEARGGKSIQLGPGEFVGELALLVPDSTRVARVRATTPVVCLAISRADFAELLHSEPRIGVAMLPVLARRLMNQML
jgi:CRP/FNR family transcriptional regulator, cyclic AMP receptor protein